MFFLMSDRRLKQLLAEQFSALHHHIKLSEERIMTEIEDVTARLEQAGSSNASALTALIAAGNKEIQQVVDALAKQNPDLTAQIARLNKVADAFTTQVQAATDAAAALGADDPADAPPPSDPGSGTGDGAVNS